MANLESRPWKLVPQVCYLQCILEGPGKADKAGTSVWSTNQCEPQVGGPLRSGLKFTENLEIILSMDPVYEA